MGVSRILACVVAAVTMAALASPPANAANAADAGPAGHTATTRLLAAAGTTLTLGGLPYRFVGVDAYELATDWGDNAGCGAMLSNGQLTSFFASLPPGAVVRFQAFQETTGINPSTLAIDWAGLDRVFAAAAAASVKLIAVLGGQGSGCDGGHWEDPAWYDGGYTKVYNSAANSDGRGLQPLSYQTWVSDVVSRYASSPALGMWEPMGEAEASTCAAADEPTNCEGNQTCPNEAVAGAALSSFFTAIGGLIHRLDPSHLVEAGLLGGGQCGTQGSDYQMVISSPGIDVASYHDYYASSMGGDQWNGIAVRIAQADAVDKPIIAGEVGIVAGVGQPGCEGSVQRVVGMAAKFAVQMAAGSSGELVWNWSPDQLGACSYNTTVGDPLMTWLATNPI